MTRGGERDFWSIRAGGYHATDHCFPDTTPADQRHTQVVVGDHFSDIDEDEREDEATSQSLDVGMDDEAPPRTDDASVTHGTCDDIAAHMTAEVAAPVVGTDGLFSATDPRRGTRAGSYSAPRLLMASPPMADRSTQTATLTTTHMAVSFPLDMTRDPGAGATAAAASTTDTGMAVGTDLNPATADLLADEHISSFLLRIRRRADGEVAGLVLGAAPSDTGTGGAAHPAPGATAPVIAADPDSDIDVGTAGGPLPDVVDFDPTSAWGGGDDEATAAIEAAPTRKRKHMAAVRADDTDDGATATGLSGDAVGAPVDAHGSATKKRRRQGSRETTRDSQKHSQRMAKFGATRGNTPRSDPGPVEGRPAEDWAGWWRS